MRYGWCESQLGRFVSRDPIRHDGGSNLYSYGMNPILYVDPEGTKLRIHNPDNSPGFDKKIQWLLNKARKCLPKPIVDFFEQCGDQAELVIFPEVSSIAYAGYTDHDVGKNKSVIFLNLRRLAQDRQQLWITLTHELGHAYLYATLGEDYINWSKEKKERVVIEIFENPARKNCSNLGPRTSADQPPTMYPDPSTFFDGFPSGTTYLGAPPQDWLK
jgi:hypothetical protein